MQEGLLIAFEGLDGSGTTTQAELTKRKLAETTPRDAYLTKEPTDGPVGSQIRLGLSGRVEFDPQTLALLFAADRMDHLAQDVEPKLENGVNVVMDRYYLSSIAYQMTEPDVDEEWLEAINAHCRAPDLTIFLDVSPEVCLRRMEETRWHVEIYETRDRLERVYDNYRSKIEELQADGEDVRVIDGDEAIEDVSAEVMEVVHDKLDGGTG